MFRSLVLATGLFGALSAGQALAHNEAMATSDLFLRAGPGPAYAALGVIPMNETVSIDHCDAVGNWCQVVFDGQIGWAYGGYLANIADDHVVMVAPQLPRQRVTTVVTEDTRTRSAVVVGGMGALAGALAGGPAGAAIGLIGGAATGGIADPGPKVTTYVVENPVEPVYLEGEIVPGARVPDAVRLYPVPQSPYQYAYINGAPVLVVPNDRQVVQVLP
ncbi:MAG: hypothetical protein B7Z02_04225 [Rhodobacterales bacterium 32-67-9]|nr:MAG: hypothetical protein B7Z02_04225 [Rhodobacterales bacterium 32-67-9]